MAITDIPPRYQAGLKFLLELTETDYEKLKTALQSIHPTSLEPFDLALAVTDVVPEASVTRVYRLLDTVISLYGLQDFLGVSPEDVVNQILSTLSEQEPLGNLSDNEKDLLAKRIGDLLTDGGVLTIVGKTRDVSRTHARTFVSARVITDMRPIFGDDVAAEPPLITLMHTLKIVYHEGHVHKEFFVALNSEDVASLGKLAEREATKTDTLRKMTGKLEKPCLES